MWLIYAPGVPAGLLFLLLVAVVPFCAAQEKGSEVGTDDGDDDNIFVYNSL